MNSDLLALILPLYAGVITLIIREVFRCINHTKKSSCCGHRLCSIEHTEEDSDKV